MNVDEFFVFFEAEFFQSFSQFAKKIFNKEDLTTDLRDLLKKVAKKWDDEKLMKTISEDLIGEHFLEINRLLNRWHHKQSTPWGYVEDIIERAIKVLKAIEKSKLSVPTQELIQKIEKNWHDVQRTTQYAFSFEIQISLEDVPEPNTSRNIVLVENILPEFNIDNLCSHIQDATDVQIIEKKMLKDNKLLLSLKTANDVETLCSNPLIFKKKEISFKPFTEESYGVVLSPIAETLDESLLSNVLANAHNIEVDSSNIQINRTSQKAIIQVSSLELKKYLLEIGTLTIKRTEIKVQDVMGETLLVCIYPFKQIDISKLLTVWENQFSFSIEGKIEELSPNFFLIKVPKEEYTSIINQYITISGDKLKIVAYSPYRIKMLNIPQTVLENETTLQKNLFAVTQDDQAIVSYILFPQTFQGYLHLNNENSKSKLLNLKSLVLNSNPKIASNLSPKTPKKKKQKLKETPKLDLKEETKSLTKFVIHQIPSEINLLDIANALRPQLGELHHIPLIRDEVTYIVISGTEQIKKLEPIKLKSTMFSLVNFLGEIPYWNLILAPIPASVGKDEVLESLKKFKVFSKIYKVEVLANPLRAELSILTQEAYNVLLSNIKTIKIRDIVAEFMDPAFQTKWVEKVDKAKIRFLKQKLNEIDLIKRKYSVLIEIIKKIGGTSIRICGKPEILSEVENELNYLMKDINQEIFLWKFESDQFLHYGSSKVKSIMKNFPNLLIEYSGELQKKTKRSSKKPESPKKLESPKKIEKPESPKKLESHKKIEKSGPSSSDLTLKITLYGIKIEVEQALSQLKSLQMSYVCDKSFRRDMLLKLQVNVSQVEKDNDVSIQLSEDVVMIFGDRQSVNSVLIYFNSLLKISQDISLVIKLSRGEFTFVNKYLKGELTQKKGNLKDLVFKDDKVVAIGLANDIDAFKLFFKSLRESLTQFRDERFLDRHLFFLVQPFLEKLLEKEKIVIYLTKYDLPLLAPSKSLSEMKTIEEEEEEEEEEKETSAPSAKYDIRAVIKVWHLAPSKPQVEAALKRLNNLKKVFHYPSEKFDFVSRNVKLDVLKTHFSALSINAQKRVLVIKAFDQEDLDAGVAYINSIETQFIPSNNKK